MEKFKSFILKKPYLHQMYMSNEDAEKLYHEAKEFPRRRSYGFYSLEMTFDEWLHYYKIKIY